MANRTFYTPRTSIPADIDQRLEMKSVFCCFNKGYTPPPFKLVHTEDDDGQPIVTVEFELNEFTQTCRCQIVCSTGALVFEEEIEEEPIGSFCPADQEFKVTLPNELFSETNPTELIFNFEDARGNLTALTVFSLIKVAGQTPLTVVVNEGARKHVQVGTPVYSKGFISLRGIATQYQIERFVEHPSNREIWVDWTTIPTTRPFHRGGKDLVHWDRDVQGGVEYGYRVRFRSTFDHESAWGDWRIVVP